MVSKAAPRNDQTATKNGSKWRLLIIVTTFIAAVSGTLYILRPAETPYTKAVALVKSGKAAAALPMLEELSRQHPENAQLFPWLAQAYLTCDRVAEGRVALDTALRLNVANTSLSGVVLTYAAYYEARGDFEEAERLYDSAKLACPAQELSEGRANLYLKWAENEMSKGNLTPAIAHLELAFKLADQVSEPLRVLVRHRLSDAYRQLAAEAENKKDDNGAAALLLKSLSVSDEPATRMALAAIDSRQKKIDDAIQNYEAVTRADSNNLEARHHLVDLLCEKKDYRSAQAALTELTDKEKSVDNFQLLASLDLKLGNYAGAVRAYEDACDLRQKPEILKQLIDVLNDWSSELTRQKKVDEALAVKGHAERVAEQLTLLTKPDKADDNKVKSDDSNNPPIALSFSRIWLAKGSLTPEGEIKIRNITDTAVNDLSLTAVFYDNTARRSTGSVVLPVATPASAPFEAGQARSLYFSCPNIVKSDHQLAVIIFWRGRLLKEFPVVKL